MQNDNSDQEDEFYQDQNNHQFDDFDSDGEELVNAASKADGFNFDDSDEEFKNHSVPLEHRGTEIK